jgi:anti-sigma factor RsiW
VNAMKRQNSHLSDQELLLDIDGELPANDEKAVRAHMISCWKCRARRQQLEGAIADFVQCEAESKLPPMEGSRALLKAQMTEISANETNGGSMWFMLPRMFAWSVGVLGLLALGLIFVHAMTSRSNTARSGPAAV